MAKLVHPEEVLQLDRPMVLVPLEEYESLLLAAVRGSVSEQESLGTRQQKKLLKFLQKIQQEKGRVLKSARAFQKYLKNL